MVCGKVNDERTMYGDFVVMIEVAAFITTMNFFASAETSPTAKAFGVSAKPANIHVVTYDQLLRETLGHVRCRTADVLADDLDLPSGDRVAVLLHVEFDTFVYLRCGVSELAGVCQQSNQS